MLSYIYLTRDVNPIYKTISSKKVYVFEVSHSYMLLRRQHDEQKVKSVFTKRIYNLREHIQNDEQKVKILTIYMLAPGNQNQRNIIFMKK